MPIVGKIQLQEQEIVPEVMAIRSFPEKKILSGLCSHFFPYSTLESESWFLSIATEEQAQRTLNDRIVKIFIKSDLKSKLELWSIIKEEQRERILNDHFFHF